MIWVGFRRIGDAPPRLAPYLAAALACNLALGTLLLNFGDMLSTVSLGLALTSSRQRRKFTNSSGTTIRAGLVKSMAISPVMSATLNRSPARKRRDASARSKRRI